MTAGRTFLAWMAAHFASNPTPMAEASVVELCDMRRETEDELHRRAMERVAAIPYARQDVVDSETWLSEDRSEVFVQFYEPLSPYGDATALSRRFPRLAARVKAFQFGGEASYGRHASFATALYEAGVDAMRAHFDAEEAERQAGYERHEREQYEKLKAKFE